MAEVTIRRYGELSRGVFALLMDKQEGLPVSQVLAQVEESVPPTPFEQATYRSIPTLRRYGELSRGVFALLIDKQERLPRSQVLAEVEESLPPTPFEPATFPKHPTHRRYPRHVRFASISPVKAGWLVKNNGVWSLTE